MMYNYTAKIVGASFGIFGVTYYAIFNRKNLPDCIAGMMIVWGAFLIVELRLMGLLVVLPLGLTSYWVLLFIEVKSKKSSANDWGAVVAVGILAFMYLAASIHEIVLPALRQMF